ncbi:DUF4386 family protein [Demequina sp.]|uniref:DUF4386 family protein n=1 Tax=Demequina sp. TaxID=2050685 RepID=UPI0025D32C8E|nr:DUF4386 family protein [Demequina sp.]
MKRLTAGIATLAFGLIGFAWTVVEAMPPLLGFEDTDDPAVMVAFLREHSYLYRVSGVLLLAMSLSLTVAVLAVFERFAATTSRSLGLRVATAFGLFAAALFVPHGALRLASASTLLHVDRIDSGWGESAYLAVQMVGTQALGAGGIVAMCAWAVGLSVLGFRARTLPRWLCVLGVVPAFRILVGFGGVFGFDSSLVWILYMLAIPGTTVWLVAFGIVLMRRPVDAPRPAASPDVAAV